VGVIEACGSGFALSPRGSQGFLAPPVPAQMGALETVTANAESCV